jgi:hypothetical protein
MPSPVKGKFYLRKDGAYVKIKGHYKKVGKDKYKMLKHYAKRDIRQDRRLRAEKSPKRKSYPQEYD